MRVSWFDRKECIYGKDVDLSVVVDVIRSCKYSVVTKGFRPAFTPSCVCNDRRQGEVVPNGIVHLDIDKHGDAAALRDRMRGDEYVLMAFVSPSGNGVKVFGVYDLSCVEFRAAWNWFKVYIEGKYGVVADRQASDIKRLCFIGDDKDIYYNATCNVIGNEEIFSVSESVESSTIANEAPNEVFDELLAKAKEYAKERVGSEYTEGVRNNYLFHCTIFLKEKGISSTAVFPLLRKIMGNNALDDREVESIVKSVYGHDYKANKAVLRGIGEQVSEGANKDRVLLAWQDYLRQRKIRSLWMPMSGGGYSFNTFIYEADGIYHRCNIDMIKSELANSAIEGRQAMISRPDAFVVHASERITADKLWMNNSEVCYLHIGGNHFIRVTKEAIGVVNGWDDYGIYLADKGRLHIRNIDALREIVGNSSVLEYVRKSIVYNFFMSVFFGGAKDIEEESVREIREKALMSLVGYIIKGYHCPHYPKAVIITDKDSIDSNEGGSGKSLILAAIESVVSVTRIDGKNYMSDDAHKFHTIKGTEKVIAFDDVAKNFDFSSIFNMLTGEFEVNRKYGERFTMSCERGYSVVITANELDLANDSSHKRRRVICEVESEFNLDYTPMQKYGKMLFTRDFTDDDWIGCALFFALCLQYWLRFGSEYIDEVFSDELGEEKKLHKYLDFDTYGVLDLMRYRKDKNTYYITLEDLSERMSKHTRKNIKTIAREFREYLKLKGYAITDCQVIKIDGKSKRCIEFYNPLDSSNGDDFNDITINDDDDINF